MSAMQRVAVVDPYSSGQYLGPEFIARGFECICVHSQDGAPPIYAASHSPDNFIEEIVGGEASFDETVARLKEMSCVAVVPGSEPGVVLANRLAIALGLPSCEPSKLESLRNKHLMQEALAAVGLRSIRQIRSADIDEVVAWVEGLGAFPVVVKPTQSCGTDNVSICASMDEVRSAFRRTYGKPDLFGNRNDSVLVQEFIDGLEHVVDSVSCDGRHYVTNVSKYKKLRRPDGSIVYDEEIYIHPDEAEVADVVAYGLKVLDALGIVFGAAHMEIMRDARGPVLIEVGARLHGAKSPKNVQLFSDVSQLDLLVDAAVAPDRFRERTSRPPKYWKKSKAIVFINDRNGTVTSVPGQSLLPTLASYALAFWYIKPGDTVQETIDLFTSPGGVFLVHPSEEVLQADTARIRQLEREGRLWIVS
jgi:biotin carboxylase